MSASQGTRRDICCVFLVIKPPSTMVSPLVALTVVWAVVKSMMGERTTAPLAATEIGIPVASGSRVDFSASISSTTVSSGLMRRDRQDQADVLQRDRIDLAQLALECR